MAPSESATRPHLLECHDCGTIQRLPAMRPGARASCPACGAHLRKARMDPFTLPLALNAAALGMFIVGAFWTLLTVSTAGQFHDAGLLTGPSRLTDFGLWQLAIVVLATTFAAPLARILCMIAVLASLGLQRRPPGIRRIYAWIEHLRPWSMVEIFLLGLFVAYVRLSDIAHIDIGPAVVALGALTVTMLAADLLLDPIAVWEALEPRGRRRRSFVRARNAATPHAPSLNVPTLNVPTLNVPTLNVTAPGDARLGCDTCGLVSRGHDGIACPRCAFPLQHRKPDSLTRAWALTIAAMVLYVPANTYPILTVIRFGAGQPSTILGGVRELLEAGMWPLALLVFFASIAVPVLKLAGLILLLVTTAAGLRSNRRDRTVLYRIVDAVGRWSMIDIFMESILVALVQFGAIVTIVPGTGAIAFAAVVILTMLAARAFDPRLIWDRAAGSPAAV